ncbi:TPA: PhoH family protein [Enterococcus faecium]|nr:PhoH family protein [Enterococcus faecium]
MKRAPLTRKKKIEAEVPKPSPKDKFFAELAHEENMRQAPVPKFTAATDNQRKQLKYLQEGRKAVWGIGAAGSGKSMVAAYHGATLLKSKKIEKILLVRPVVHVGNSVGMLKGSLEEKLAPWFAQTVAHLEKFLGKGYTSYCLEKGIISFCAVEFLRGYSFEDTYVICEESQGFTEAEYEMMLTRIGNNSQVCFTGDERQSAARDCSGLTALMNMIKKVQEDQPDYLDDEDLDVFFNDIGVVTYTVHDIQRSGLVKAFCKVYYHKE